MNKQTRILAIIILAFVLVAGLTFRSKAPGTIEVLDDTTFAQKTQSGKVVVDFYADWCVPCKQMMPHYEQAASKMGNIKFFKVNIEKAPKVIRDLDISSIPTLVVFQDGKEVSRESNAFDSSESIKTFISK